MPNFAKDFHTLNYVIKESPSILLFAHSHPDGDTTGANLSLKEYIKSLGKKVDISCLDVFPQYLRPLADEVFYSPDDLDISSYKLIIAADSVERGFQKIRGKITPDQIVALIDHHPDIKPNGDINIIDPNYSSVCEMVYEFFVSEKIAITRPMATVLLLGILGDTGMFQHSNTTPRVLDISAKLMQLGAPIARIAEVTFGAKKVCTLKLWGRAFEKARFVEKNGMIFSVLTKKDLAECEATSEDISQVAGILNTVPGTKFSLILSEREDGMVKGSLRSEEYKGVDVSRIAATFGGGGHKLASGFEMKGKVVETDEGWKVV
jgi:bifunctional oligoribonuclease and PAP phosphatase NrnA